MVVVLRFDCMKFACKDSVVEREGRETTLVLLKSLEATHKRTLVSVSMPERKVGLLEKLILHFSKLRGKIPSQR